MQGSPENVLNPLAIYRMARTALHEKGAQKSASNSPSTQNTSSPATKRSRLGRSRNRDQPRMEMPVAPSPTSAQTLNEFPGSSIYPGMEHFYMPQSREDPSMAMGSLIPMNAGLSGTWDPADLAVMDILDGGIAPWTAEYLTDGQSGVDPFLFPF